MLHSKVVFSGNIASGQVGHPHVSSGAITSGQLGVGGNAPDGTNFLRDDFTWAAPTATVGSGAIGSGKVASGAVPGFFGPYRGIMSGTVGVFDFGSGAVVAGTVGSGAIVSGNIASGQVGHGHIAAQAVASGQLDLFAVTQANLALFNDASWPVNTDALAGTDLVPVYVGVANANRAVALNSGLAKQLLGGTDASGVVRSGNIASGSIGRFHIASGQLAGFELGSGAIVSGRIASGQVGFRHLADGSVQSGTIASGNVGQMHLASGAVNSGHVNMAGTPDGTQFFRDDFTWAQPTATVGSGAIGSGKVASGTVQGFFGTTRHIASGTVGAFDFGSGAVVAGSVGSGAIVSGNIASGQVGPVHIASGAIGSGLLVSGAIKSGNIGVGTPDATKFLDGTLNWSTPGAASVGSGDIGSGKIASGAVQGFFGSTRHIASGTLGVFDFGSGAVAAGAMGSGSVQGFFGALPNIASGTVGVFDFGSGAVIAGAVGSGAVVSGNIASGQIGPGHIASGAIQSGDVSSGTIGGFFGHPRTIQSGSIGQLDLAFLSVASGHIASGSIFWLHHASGDLVDQCQGVLQYASGLTHMGPFLTEETVSGVRAVVLSASGTIKIAKAGLSGSMPAIGVVVLNVASGIQCDVVVIGTYQFTSGLADYSGYVGRNIFVGRSGQLVTCSGSFNSGGLLSGDIVQPLGTACSSGGASLNVAASLPFVVGGTLIVSGQHGSGSVFGFFGPSRTIASGTVGVFDFGSGAVIAGAVGSGAVVSGNIASGQIGDGHFASGQIQGLVTKFSIGSGTFTGFELGSGSIVSGRVASGQIGFRHLADGSVQSGTIASGNVGRMHMASGAINSGHLNTTGTPDGTLFLRDDFTWTAPTASVGSGGIGSGKIASGTVQGFFGTTRHIASGTVGVFDFGSGAVVAGSVGSGAIVSGNVASGQVGNFHISSGAVTSGRLGVTGNTPDGTNFLRDDFTWAAPTATVGSGGIGSGKIASGTVQGFFGTTRHIASGTVGVFDFGSGAVVAGSVGSGAIVSGNAASGQISTFHFASGAQSDRSQYATLFSSGLTRMQAFITEEIVSGVRAVTLSTSGQIKIAKAGLSGSMPAIGIVKDNVASGIQADVYMLGTFQFTSGLADYSGYVGRCVFVGRSGQIVTASGSFNSGGLLSGDVSQPVGIAVSSGGAGINVAATLPFVVGGTLVVSGQHGSGSVFGFFGPSRTIASGTVGVFDFGSGAVIAGAVGSGAIVSGNIASGVVGDTALASGSVMQSRIASGVCVDLDAPIVSGFNALTSGMTEEAISGMRAVCVSQSGNIRIAMASVSGRMPAIGVVMDNVASGIQVNVYTMGVFRPTSGLIDFSGHGSELLYVGRSGHVCTASGWFNSGGLLSGDITQPVGWTQQDFSGVGNPKVIGVNVGAMLPMVVGQIISGDIASGQIGRTHLASGTDAWGITKTFICAETISGTLAVCLSVSGTGTDIVRAERQSGLRMPAVGVTVSGAVSGTACDVVMYGHIYTTFSGGIASGFIGLPLYVGSGGLIVNLSGFMGGSSSGPGVGSFSGSYIAVIGIATSGGIFVSPTQQAIRLATLSGSYLKNQSGNYPVSGFF